MNILRIGLVFVSDRTCGGVYQDKGIPALEAGLSVALAMPFKLETRLIPDEQRRIEQMLCELVDQLGCHLMLTTGGTGPAPRDVTHYATLGGRRSPDALLWRANAPNQPALCANSNSFTSGRCDPPAGVDY